MRQVSKDEFFKRVGGLNCHPQIQGNWPYTSLWKMIGYQDTGKVIGKSVCMGDAIGRVEYFLS